MAFAAAGVGKGIEMLVLIVAFAGGSGFDGGFTAVGHGGGVMSYLLGKGVWGVLGRGIYGLLP